MLNNPPASVCGWLKPEDSRSWLELRCRESVFRSVLETVWQKVVVIERGNNTCTTVRLDIILVLIVCIFFFAFSFSREQFRGSVLGKCQERDKRLLGRQGSRFWTFNCRSSAGRFPRPGSAAVYLKDFSSFQNLPPSLWVRPEETSTHRRYPAGSIVRKYLPSYQYIWLLYYCCIWLTVVVQFITCCRRNDMLGKPNVHVWLCKTHHTRPHILFERFLRLLLTVLLLLCAVAVPCFQTSATAATIVRARRHKEPRKDDRKTWHRQPTSFYYYCCIVDLYYYL